MTANIGPYSFDEILDKPQCGAKLNSGCFLINVALGTECGMVIGLRAGYTFSPFESGWEMEGKYLIYNPDGGITRQYIRMMIGGWIN